MATRTLTRQAVDAGLLADYAAKRSFDQTPEPASSLGPRRDACGPLLFVIQQHSARRMHFDFRLELDGVLKSWAVPKGLAIAPGERHLAVPTEDHPFDYGSFEGVIPPKQYGAGPVIVWDCGVYAPNSGTDGAQRYSFDDREAAQRRLREDFARGKLSIFLLGGKLKGSYSLVKSAKPQSGDRDWLLIKHRDDFIDVVTAAADKTGSLLSGHTVEEIRSVPPPPRLRADELAPYGPVEPMPKKLSPMLAALGERIPAGPDWRYEPKLDGYRVIAFVERDEVRLHSRRGLDMTRAFPEIVQGLRAACLAPMVLDGEIIALGADGKPSFNALQNRAQLKADVDIARAVESNPCVLACFDILHFAGMNLRKGCYRDRARWLSQVLLPVPHIQRIESVQDGESLYAASLDAGFEGIVAKRLSGAYESGVRSSCWVKLKAVQSEDFFIGGFAEGRGSRSTLGSLLVGTPAGDGTLLYAGRVGTGFDETTLERLKARFDELKIDKPPFTKKPPTERPTTWLRPELVAEVKFVERTRDGLLRAPVFLRLRDDVDASTQNVVDAAPARKRSARSKGMVRTAHPTGTSSASSVAWTKPARRVRRAHHAPEAHEASPYDDTRPILDALDSKDDSVLVKLGDERFGLSHLDKVLWPADRKLGVRAYTKRDFLRYLANIWPYMAPHMKDRPVTMIRMPEGIAGERFFHKHWRQNFPAFFEEITLFSAHKDEAHRFFLCQNAASLVWLGQVGTLEFHVWHSRASLWPEAAGGDVDAGTDYASSLASLEASILNRPDWVVFDIDPYIYSGKEAKGDEPEYNRKAFDKGKEIALRLRDLLEHMGLRSLVKTSGKTGLHIFVPIVRNLDFDETRRISEAVSRHLQRENPKDITTEWSVSKRTGKIFMDYNMNSRGKTLNVVYSPRGAPGAPVSMPLTWEELESVQPGDFTMQNALDRLARTGDLWADALRFKQNLAALIKFWKA